MKATLVTAVRRNVRTRDEERPTYAVVRRDEIDAPENYLEKQLAVAIPLAALVQAMGHLGGFESDLFDAVEFTVDFGEADTDDIEERST